MSHSFHHLATREVYELCQLEWPIFTVDGRIETAPPWPLKDPVQTTSTPLYQSICRDVNSSVLDNFSTQLGASKFALCIHQDKGKFSAYAAVKSATLHKPREENLRDYRLGPDVRGILNQISIALLPEDREEDQQPTVLAVQKSIIEKTQKWFGSLSEVLTFGGGPEDVTEDAGSQRKPGQNKEEQELMRTARTIKEKISKKKLLLVWPGMHISTGGQRMIITDAVLDVPEVDLAKRCGFATTRTSVLPSLDDQGEFRKVQVCPFLDTIPQTYEIDLFQDALGPFFAKNPLVVFAQGDTFKYNTVEFKIVSTDPKSLPRRVPLERAIGLTTDELMSIVPPNNKKQRVGPSTAVCLGYPILPHWIDILPPERQHIVMSLPTPLESIMLLSFVSESGPSEIERVMNATEAMRAPTVSAAKKAHDMADAMQKLRVAVTDTMREDGVCTVCLGEFKPDEEVIKLECSHVFHLQCLSNWLVRTKTCPLCKAELSNIDIAASKAGADHEANQNGT